MQEIKLKQYVIVPKKPKMSAGKIASQCCHATFMALEKQRELISEEPDHFGGLSDTVIDEWKKSGMCVIVLECKDTVQLLGIAEYLKQWKIPSHLYLDEGLTEVDMGTPTALATGVLNSEEKGWMFQQLRLFR